MEHKFYVCGKNFIEEFEKLSNQLKGEKMDYTKVESTGKDIRKFVTGSVRDNAEGKGRWDLIPYYPLLRVAVHFENGAKKYGDRNWEKGQPLNEYLSSAMRHLMKFANGENGEDHLSACIWNCMAFIETENKITQREAFNADQIEYLMENLHPTIAKRIREALHDYNLKKKLNEMGTELKDKIDKATFKYAVMLDKDKEREEGMNKFRGILNADKPKFKMFYPIRVDDYVLVKDNPEQYFGKRIICTEAMSKMAGKVYRVEDKITALKESMIKLRDVDGNSWWFTMDSVERVADEK